MKTYIIAKTEGYDNMDNKILYTQKAVIEKLEEIKSELLDESYHLPEDDFEDGKMIVEWEDIERILNNHLFDLIGITGNRRDK